jgi:hypothetical protein
MKPFFFVLGVYAWAGFVFAQNTFEDFSINGAWGSGVELCTFLGVVSNETNTSLLCDASVSEVFVTPGESLPSVVNYLRLLSVSFDFCYFVDSGFLVVASNASALCVDSPGGVDGFSLGGDSVAPPLGMVSGSASQDVLSSSDEGLLEATQESAEASPDTEPVAVRLRVIEIGENSGLQLGTQWSTQILSDLLSFAVGDVYAPYRLLTSDLADAVRLVESSGAGRKLDDILLNGIIGVPLSFQAGGTVNVNLVGAGEQNISASYPYGLTVAITANRLDDGTITLDYSIDSSSTVSASDPSLINVASRGINSSVDLFCGEAAIIAAFRQDYSDNTGSGLPGLGSLPVVGYAFAVDTFTATKTTLLVSLEVACEV